MVTLRSGPWTRCLQHLLRHGEVDRCPRDGGVGDQLDQRAFQLAHVRLRLRGMKMRTSSGRLMPSASAFLSRIAILVSRSGGWMSTIRPHSKRDRSRSTRPGSILRLRIARDDDLLLVIVEFVEGVKELFLRPLLAAENVDIVDQQHVSRPVMLVELRHPVQLDALDHLVHEPFAGGVDDRMPRKLSVRARPMACIRWVFPCPRRHK